MSIMLAITCYRCAPQITRLLAKLEKSSCLDKFKHIAIIDNRSPDNTCLSASNFLESSPLKLKTSIYLNNENFGLGGSHKVAFGLANQLSIENVLIIHGDDQASVDDIITMINFYERHSGCAAILGSRFSLKSKRIGYQKIRVFGNLFLNLIFTIITFRPTFDLGSGLNLFNLKELQAIQWINLSDQFSFNSELLLEMYKHHCRVHFLPITWREEDQQSNAKNLSVALQMINTLINWRFNIPKIKTKLTYDTDKIIVP
ncbi:MAG: glycosyltransferase family 2 protein [Bacteriovorax sp.]|nr:glycosyltransferase family 2 protein [Bacteriovorax sp.]